MMLFHLKEGLSQKNWTPFEMVPGGPILFTKTDLLDPIYQSFADNIYYNWTPLIYKDPPCPCSERSLYLSGKFGAPEINFYQLYPDINGTHHNQCS